MKKSIYLYPVLFLIVIPSIFSQTALTILDFDVESSNREYQFLGKGFTQFLSVELSQVKTLTLVERKKRNQMIEEIKFGLSGMADEESLVKLGNMLQSDYLVAGEIFDIAGSLVVTARLINIETGTVESQVGAEGTAGDYKYITRDLSLSILEALNIDPGMSLKTISQSRNDQLVLASFSTAVAAYDKGDEDTARDALAVAKDVDENNKAVRQLADALKVISPKFQFEDPMWQSAYSPAVSVMLDRGLLYFRSDLFPPWEYMNGGIEVSGGTMPYDPSNNTAGSVFTVPNKFHFGFNFPVSDTLGINSEVSLIYPGEEIQTVDADNHDTLLFYPVIIDGDDTGFQGCNLRNNEIYLGLTAGASYRILKQLSAGLNLSVFFPLSNGSLYSDSMINPAGNVVLPSTDSVPSGGYVLPDIIGFAINPALAFNLLSGNLFIDLNANIPFLTRYFYDPGQDAFINGHYPVYLSNSINGTLVENILFGGLKTNLDIYTDEEASGIYLKVTPVLELWLGTRFSLRAGYIFSYINLKERSAVGHGFMGGFSFSGSSWDLDLSFNNRAAPMYSWAGAIYQLYTITLNLSFNDI